MLHDMNHSYSPFCCGYFGPGSHILPMPAWKPSFPPLPPHQWVSWTIFPGWPGTTILTTSASLVTRTTGKSH
jgi:hypothetical protein